MLVSAKLGLHKKSAQEKDKEKLKVYKKDQLC